MTHSFLFDRAAAVVDTAQGPVRGFLHDGLAVFRGVPYAQARRFHAPEPPAKREKIFEAGSYGFVCPLLEHERPNGELLVPHRYWPEDEDCQNLNLWTPGCDGGKRPVLVWLHGGGFYGGSSIEQIAYDGASLARCGDAVVVTVNHRLNILGYLDLSDCGTEYANSANAGGDDIIAALRWLRENVAAFGGDPDNVTVFGQSGGGAKVTALLQSPAADGLYRRGIVMSGVLSYLLADDGTSDAYELAEALMNRLGLGSARELETVDYRLLAEAYNALKPVFEREGKYVGCAPRPNAFYRGDPCRFGFREETKDVPLVVGSVFGEFQSFRPSPFDREAMSDEEQRAALASVLGEEGAAELIPLFRAAYPERALVDLMNLDFLFRGPEIDYIARRSRLNGSTWSYLFNMDQPVDGGRTPWHCSDIPYAFRNIDLVEYPHGPQADPGLSARVQEQIFSAVLAFARTGDPNTGLLPAWPACSDGSEHTLVIDAKPRVLTNFDHALIAADQRIMGPVLMRQMAAMKKDVQH